VVADAQIALKDRLERFDYGPNPKPAPLPGECILSRSYSYQRTVLKTVMGAISSWVRIPLPPPVLGTKKPRRFRSAGFLFWTFWQTQTNLWTNLLLAHLI